jgi:hypothetical protein
VCVRSHTDTHSHHDVHINTMGRVPHPTELTRVSALSGISEVKCRTRSSSVPTCLSIYLLLSDFEFSPAIPLGLLSRASGSVLIDVLRAGAFGLGLGPLCA